MPKTRRAVLHDHNRATVARSKDMEVHLNKATGDRSKDMVVRSKVTVSLPRNRGMVVPNRVMVNLLSNSNSMVVLLKVVRVGADMELLPLLATRHEVYASSTVVVRARAQHLTKDSCHVPEPRHVKVWHQVQPRTAKQLQAQLERIHSSIVAKQKVLSPSLRI